MGTGAAGRTGDQLPPAPLTNYLGLQSTLNATTVFLKNVGT